MPPIRTALFAAAVALLALAPAGHSDARSFDEAERRAVEQIVRDYLMKNPEVIVEAMEELQKREQLAEQQKARQAITANRDALIANPADPVAGNPKGDVTVVEFFDYQCGYCKTVMGDVQRLIDGDSKVRFVFKEFPILGPGSLVAARAALASQSQGKYLEFHNALMGHRGQYDEATILRLAGSVGLDTAKLKTDMASAEVEKAIAANHALADSMGIRGTPAFVIGDELVPGAIRLEQMKALVAKVRKEG
ncbi:DsbA family protein [Azospirillum halopraeferens]|uniref:DsbA family protein n=1 Tax=Azospirillum halopraeferens TaxID=34010 RepID=UPI0003F930C0|nr:DsbA family protein [Azospirillum halopraeferens]